MKKLQQRLARLEHSNVVLSTSYVVRLPAEALGDAEAVSAAITEHQSLSSQTSFVLLAPIKMTMHEWVAHYGRPDEHSAATAKTSSPHECSQPSCAELDLFEEGHLL
jgi:hypothetical protein